MSRQRGWGTYLILIVVLIVLFMYLPGVMNQSENVSNTEYETLLEDGRIVSATIEQNQEAPTGAVRFQTEDGVTGRVNVSDVNEAQDDLKAKNVKFTVGGVSRDSIFFSLILPVLLVGFVVIMFMSMMNPFGGRRKRERQNDEFREEQSQNDHRSG